VSVTPFLVLGVGVLGLLVGSFLNVVVHRVPVGLSVVRPPSACPSCAHPIRSRDNVPIVSWMLLGGRCRDCSAAVSLRYPAVEAATGLLFAALAAAYGPSAVLPALLYVAAAGVALTLIDLDHHRLPDAIVLPSYPVLVVLLAVAGLATADPPVLRALLSTGIWLAVYAALWSGTRGRGMGLGDVKLSGLLGLLLGWLGWGPSVLGLFGGFAVGSVIGLVLIASGRLDRRTPVPHGPFMLVGAALGAFAGGSLWHAALAAAGMS
jgi:leader peptidase (prepilin peptidase) / N-methyltransferase